MRKKLLASALALALFLTSCGGGTAATSIHLRKTEGTVGVSDNGGKEVPPRDGLGLYSGYGVDTRTESYAWIDLDDVKLTKLDQDSEIAITKEGKNLEIEVLSGSLFFNVTQPLADDESMNIRTSSMAVGIRGTCGWVTQDTAALLEGTVEVTAGEQSVTVSAGEMAVMTAEDTLEVVEFSSQDIPAFVREELEEDEALAEAIPDPAPLYPLTVLTRQSTSENEFEHTSIIDYFYDEEGYILRRENNIYVHGELIDTHICTYSYDGEGHFVITTPDETYERPYVPGTIQPIGAFNHIITHPLVTGESDKRSEIGPDGRWDDPHSQGYYAIYTMNADGYPVNIETYASDGTHTGTCTLEWAVIDPT